MDAQETYDIKNLLSKINQTLEKNFKLIIELLGDIHLELKL